MFAALDRSLRGRTARRLAATLCATAGVLHVLHLLPVPAVLGWAQLACAVALVRAGEGAALASACRWCDRVTCSLLGWYLVLFVAGLRGQMAAAADPMAANIALFCQLFMLAGLATHAAVLVLTTRTRLAPAAEVAAAPCEEHPVFA